MKKLRDFKTGIPVVWVSLIALLASAPVVASFFSHHVANDELAAVTATDQIQDLEVNHRKIDGLLFKIQGFSSDSVDNAALESEGLVRSCHENLERPWYQTNEDTKILKASLADYCDVAELRDQQITIYRDESAELDDALEELTTLVKPFDGDKHEADIEDLERAIRKYSLHPTEAGENKIKNLLGTLRGRKYATFRAFVVELSAMAKSRADLLRTLTSKQVFDSGEIAKDAHFTASLKYQSRSTSVRNYLTLLSGSFALLITFVVFRLFRTKETVEHLNHTLEKKVEERTVELQDAMTKLADQQSYLAHSAKMSALGEMAGGIAHEINTPLASISLTAELLAEDAADLPNKDFTKGLNSISSIVERISRIVQGLKRFSRSDEIAEHVDVTFTQILDDTLLLCAEKFKARGVKLEIVRKDDNAKLSCAPEQISQVLINLLNNSVDAVEGLSITQRWIRIESSEVDGHFAAKVVDGGVPIADEVRQKLMQPFFTTKEIGKGTGLGLSISKGIMASHQGTLEFDGSAEHTTFVMTMPSLTASPKAKPLLDKPA